MDVITMRRLPLLIILVIIVSSPPTVAGKAVPEPTQRDVFLYDYFSQVMVRFEYSLKYALTNESYSLTLANTTFKELELLHEESLYYQDKGLNLTVMHVLPPFYEFSKQLILLDDLTLQFQNNPNPKLAAGILGTIRNMESLLNTIDALKLRNGTKVLVFDTTGVRKQLEELKKMVSQVPPTEEFTIGVSDRQPILNETITIFGTCPNNETVTIVVTNGNSTVFLAITPKAGFFSTEYRFDALGTYEIHATQAGKRSNTVNVTVRKIPTFFVISGTYSAFINETINLQGKLVDYYGNPLRGRRIFIGNKVITTGHEGEFSEKYTSHKPETLKITLSFEGDETHTGTTREVLLVFKKYPVSISLNGPTEISLKEEARFKGTINPPLRSPLTVYVNNSPAFNITPSNGTFTFTLNPNNPGKLEIYVEFPGNNVYEKAISNVITITTTPPKSMTARYVSIAILAIILTSIVLMERRKKESKRSPIQPPTPTPTNETPHPPEELIYIPEDIGEAYKLLREKLKDTFGISESMTPREALRTLKGWGLYPYLEKVTLLHEKAVYGEIELNEKELNEFREGIKRLLGGVAG